ncbi:MAG: type II toxin-antitoxin system Phd/YefM family antitoxin [Rhodocyclaceae bacterium]
METVNVHEAKTHLSRLLERAAAGAEIVIARAGRPVARLVPMEKAGAAPRRLGILAGKRSVPDDIDGPFAGEIEAMFYGRPEDSR